MIVCDICDTTSRRTASANNSTIHLSKMKLPYTSLGMWKNLIIYWALWLHQYQTINLDSVAEISSDYFSYKHVPYVCYITCKSQTNHKTIMKQMISKGVRISVKFSEETDSEDFEKSLYQKDVAVGVLFDATCDNMVLIQASQLNLFDSMHTWLLVDASHSGEPLMHNLQHLNLSIDSDVVVARYDGIGYTLTDVFNYGKIQGNPLETRHIGTWTTGHGLNISSHKFKYYDRWNFNNLTLRAITVVLGQPKDFNPDMLSDVGYMAGVSVMTKIVTQMLDVLKEKHNFRFNYTVAGRWIGSPERNSTLAVTNSLYWRDQDISYTCARIFAKWLDWVDVFFPPATTIETKFYYLILDKGVGNYENRFLTPLSNGVWWCTLAASVACAILLVAAALLEDKPEPASFGFFSVFAVICQQAFEDGIIIFEETFSSQGRRFVLMLVGIMSMLLYNYYTSSVVSWLLNAAAPTIADLDALIASDLELVFEDIGYTRGWIDNPSFYYFVGYKNPKEDILREKKITKAKRTTALLQPATAGIELIRTGEYAYHTEPYTAYQTISKTFTDRELCELGSLQMMPPAYVYIMGQKRSPYKQYFVWSLMRLVERGHASAARARVSGASPSCSGHTPRALALGQAAPAFLILATAAVATLFILMFEILWHRHYIKKQATKRFIPTRMMSRQRPVPRIMPREYKKTIKKRCLMAGGERQ